jgi:hypothetical protein
MRNWICVAAYMRAKFVDAGLVMFFTNEFWWRFYFNERLQNGSEAQVSKSGRALR